MNGMRYSGQDRNCELDEKWLHPLFCWQGEMKYAVVGDMPAPTYFTVDENTGQLSVKADLKESDAFTYKVGGNVMLHFD